MNSQWICIIVISIALNGYKSNCSSSTMDPTDSPDDGYTETAIKKDQEGDMAFMHDIHIPNNV